MFIHGQQIHFDQGSSGKPPGVLDGSGTHPAIGANKSLQVDLCLSLERQQT
jgi:hypothetical protein